MTPILGYCLLAIIAAFCTYRQWCIDQYELGKRASRPEKLFGLTEDIR